jgi:hypothetical protein
MTAPSQKRANQIQDSKRHPVIRLTADAAEVVTVNRREGESASKCASRLIVEG